MLDLRNRQELRWGQLKQARTSRMAHWQEIVRWMFPYSGRFFVGQRDQRESDWNEIIDETAAHSHEVMSAGLMSTRTSPARPWFKLQTPDPDLNKQNVVKRWLSDVEVGMRRVFRRSNTYLAYTNLYDEVGAFGNGASIIVDDDDTLIHHHVLTIGEYGVATNARGKVDTLYREFVMSVAEAVKEFGLENCSKTVKTLWSAGELNSPVRILHAIEPRADRDPSKIDVLNMPWASTYWEEGRDDGKYLRQSGFTRFPCAVPRWRVRANDVWGEGPGTMTLGSSVALQRMHLRYGEAVDYQTKPPLQVPPELQSRDSDLLPGGMIPYEQTTPSGGIRSAYQVETRLDHLLASIEDTRRRIQTGFFVPLFQPLAALSDTTQRTAAEIMQRREEMLTMLGPVTQRLQNDMDEPIIEATFDRMVASGMIPPVPDELRGADLDIEFIGPLAQAMKAVEAASSDRFVMTLGSLAQAKPEVLDRLDADEWVDYYGDLTGVDPRLIVPGPQAAIIRKKRAEAEAAAAQIQAAQAQAATARDMASASTDGNNLLTDAMRGVSGYQ